MDASEALFKSGYWTWEDDPTHPGLVFVSRGDPTAKTTAIRTPVSVKPGREVFPTSIKFKETLDNVEKVTFRRFFQRRVRFDETAVVTIQDVKDIALYIANPKDLTVEFIRYFHLPEMDRFLRALIIYMQYYLQVWDDLSIRKDEARKKLRQPIVTVLENIVRDDLADLRSMAAREYCVLISGIGKTKKFHHLNTSNNSLSEKDRRLFEALICMTVRICWIALQRRHLSLLELEINRIFRTDLFNLIAHRGKLSRQLTRTSEEERILLGTAAFRETKLSIRSPLCKEILYAKHDHKMLGIGFKTFEPSDARLEYLEAIYTAPEELLLAKGVSAGLVGIPRDEVDCLLLPRERTSKNFDKAALEIPEVKIPRPEKGDKAMPKQFPQLKCKYEESEQTKMARLNQQKMWIRVVQKTISAGAETTTKLCSQVGTVGTAEDVRTLECKIKESMMRISSRQKLSQINKFT